LQAEKFHQMPKGTSPLFTDYAHCLQFLYQSLPMYQRVGASAYKKDLHNTLKMCEDLGNPQQKFRSIHVAGTNGKGSTSHMLAAIFQAAGYKTGLYTSPHLKEFTERIRINGQEMPQQKVLDFVNTYREFVDELQPSFFEWTVAMAFHHFSEEQVDIAIIEVGMGGRLDSTNVITPEVSVITNISFDHKQFLGDTLEKIALEKAGIIKPGVPVVVSEYQEEVWPIFVQKAETLQAPLTLATNRVRVMSSDNGCFQLEGMAAQEIPRLFPQLQGNYQRVNLPGVLATVEILRQRGYSLSPEVVKEGIERCVDLTGLKGRWQTLHLAPRVICDTAHNEAGLRWVIDQLMATPHRHLHMVLGVAADKELEPLFHILPRSASYWFCQAHIPRALDAHHLAQAAKEAGISGRVVLNVNEALQAALSECQPEDLVFVGGSNFTVAELHQL
jgi:dihydrofolate synthase / folylpolyglutamate synthase